MEGLNSNVGNNSDSEQNLNNIANVNENTSANLSSTSNCNSSNVRKSKNTFFSKIIKGVRVRRTRNFTSTTSSSVINNERSLILLPNNEVDNDIFRINRQLTREVTIGVLKVEGLPRDPSSGNKLYCRIRSSTKKCTSNGLDTTNHINWIKTFNLNNSDDNNFELSFWDKGTGIKNFMGKTTFDISNLVVGRTHEICQNLEDGFGKITFTVTICNMNPPLNGEEERLRTELGQFNHTQTVNTDTLSLSDFYSTHRSISKVINTLTSDPQAVGKLFVKVIEARGLNGLNETYCKLELDNQNVKTHLVKDSKPVWNKCFLLDVQDVSSTLDLKLYYKNYLQQMKSLGRVSIPLTDIVNGRTVWIGLKDKYNRSSANRNSPRIKLEMHMKCNLIKATARLFKPQQVKYTKKPPGFETLLVYSNLKFIRETFNGLFELNEQYKRFLEWDNQELSFVVLIVWLVFWFYFKMWVTPLLLALMFLYFGLTHSQLPEERYRVTGPYPRLAENTADNSDNTKTETESYTELVRDPKDIKDITMTVTGGVSYLVSVTERLYNLATFKVPFLSYIAMIMLTASAFAFYFIPFNHMMMGFGIFKFTRKYLNPKRTLNNDFLDFITRVPDNIILKDWKPIKIPEPTTQPNPPAY